MGQLDKIRASLRRPRRSRAAAEKENARRGDSSIKQALPDDPIYTRGFVIGGRFSKRTPRSSDDEKGES